MEFIQLKLALKSHVKNMAYSNKPLFVTNTDKNKLWELYLNSFPPETNEIFREKRVHDCNACRRFIQSFGNIVCVTSQNTLQSIWDFSIDNMAYRQVIQSMSLYVKSNPIIDFFLTKEDSLGTDINYETGEDGSVITWNHFHISTPAVSLTQSSQTINTFLSKRRDIKEVFQRSLEDISEDAICTVLELISQRSLYKGDEWKEPLTKFLEYHKKYHNSPQTTQDNYCWATSYEAGPVIGKIKNHSIGVLLLDVSNNVDLNVAVAKYEKIVAPTNYKRPQAIFTQKMLTDAKNKILGLGFLDSLERRFATIDDITIQNILFANKNTKHIIQEGDVFDELSGHVTHAPKTFHKIPQIPIEEFIKNILPTTTELEIFVEHTHAPNFMSLIAPKIPTSPSMFKWDNSFSWTYVGNTTDSIMKERVKSAGGNVDGVLRFSIQWNEKGDNVNDFDAHCIEPNTNHIYFGNKGRIHLSSGMLDVDIMHPSQTQVAVENITWTDSKKMQDGVYKFFVHNYAHRGGRSGFTAEIEYGGNIWTYNYKKNINQDEKVTVAKIQFSKTQGVTFIESLEPSISSQTIWSVPTNTFHQVSMFLLSPNYWNEQRGVGHKHYFFILPHCINESAPNGFLNEFLKEELLEHKRVFEALGYSMRVKHSNNQLSGLGFSSTKPNMLICKVHGSLTQTIKLTI
ncbi:MAG: hypothetical protein ACE5RJ_01670 [Nitrosopumilaceae archaeon]